jgi:hypothetical protein
MIAALHGIDQLFVTRRALQRLPGAGRGRSHRPGRNDA